MANLSQFGSSVKSREAWTVSMGSSTSGTATITALGNLAKSALFVRGFSQSGTSPINDVRVALTNSTTITATRNTGGFGTDVFGEVVEYV